MKHLSLIAMLLVFTGSTLLSDVNKRGDCNSTDSTLQYKLFVLDRDHENKLFHAFMDFCEIDDFAYFFDHPKKIYKPVLAINYNGTDYNYESCEVKLMWRDIDFQYGTNMYLVELTHADTSIAFIYGSWHHTGNPYGNMVTYAYILTMDDTNEYADGYDESELSFVEIYNKGDSYLYEIHDTDRDDEFVGVKYLSKSTGEEYQKFIKVNN